MSSELIHFLYMTVGLLIVACDAAFTNYAGPTPASVLPAQTTHSPAPTTSGSLEMTTTPDSGSDFPLAVRNTWVYQAVRHQAYPIPETMTTTHVITDTVIDVKTISPFIVATIHRDESAETPMAVPPNMLDILLPATSRNYWLIVKGNRLYREENRLDLSSLDEALLELVFPLEPGAQWYQSDLLTKRNPTPQSDAFELRKITKTGAVNVPARRFDACYFLQEEWAGTSFENWYCPAVGWVDRKIDHHGTLEGWRQVLIRYQVSR